jgi:chromosomal replication initiation ATPase DnaA
MKATTFTGSIYSLAEVALRKRKGETVIDIDECRKQQLQKILQDVCRVFEQSMLSVTGKRQDGELVLCRKIYGYVAYTRTVDSFERVGMLINRDRHAIMHYYDQVTGFLDVSDSKFLPYWNKYLSESDLFSVKDFQ